MKIPSRYIHILRTLCKIILFVILAMVIFFLMAFFVIELYFPGVSLNQIVFHTLYLDGHQVLSNGRLVFIVLASTIVILYILKRYPLSTGLCLLSCLAYFTVVSPLHSSAIKEDKQIPLFKQLFLSLSYTSLYKNLAPTPLVHLPEHPQNLILIFAESTESTFEDIRHQNLIPNLSALAKQHTAIRGYQPINGTNWTLASHVSTLCGVPLRMQLRDKLGPNTAHFLPHAVCLPDLLAQLGYYNVFAGGTYSTFVGTDVFVNEHHFDELWGRDELIENKYASPQDAGLPELGLNDKILFTFARKTLARLSAQKQPFFLVLTTLDTHFPHGYVQPECSVKYHDTRDAIICSEKILVDFVTWYQKQPFAKDTILVIVGDHLMMTSSDISKLLEQQPHRETYNVIITPDGTNPSGHIYKPHSQMDWSATLLDLLNITDTPQLGLGRSLLRQQPTLVEQMGFSSLEKEVLKNSSQYNALLGI